MTRNARLGLAAITVGAAVAATGGSATGDKATPKLMEAQFAQLGGGPVRGLVVATHRPKARGVRLHVSLHRGSGASQAQDGADTYRIIASTRRCSADFDLDGAVDGADYLVWRTSIIMANTEGDMHVKSARLAAPLKSSKSIRVFAREGGGGKFTQQACGPTQRWATFPSS